MSRDIETRLSQIIVSPDIPITEAIPILDRGGIGVLLLCTNDRHLVGVLTDGDIRRALLGSTPFNQPCLTIASKQPLVGHAPISISEALHLMDHGKPFIVDHLPIVDEEGHVIDLLLRRDLINEEQLGLSAVIMAGGFGTRLRPLTEDMPKPMLPVGERPLIELTIEKLRQAGVRQVNITTHYMPEKIKDYFGDGKEFGVTIKYVAENEPLGTAGALGLLDAPSDPLLVINGDILTQVDFRAMAAFHRRHKADLTVAVRQYGLKVPYGVVECEGPYIRQVREKPTVNFLVNAGIYLLEPAIHSYIPTAQYLDMPELIQRLIGAGRSVVSFPIVEYWLDIGQLSDYEQAQEDLRDGRLVI